jgi:hypothetical protein
MHHIGQQWRKKHLMVNLETKLMGDKFIRDAFVNQVSKAASRLQYQPLARSMPHTQMFQRKLTAWSYNQHGLFRGEFHHIHKVDHNHGETGMSGTREWVPWANIHAHTMSANVKSGKVMCHRVHWRGYGLDPHLQRGKWTHRWNKTFVRDHLQYTRS